ncbi:hypothetical protein [Streptomyces acidiscabies]|uniref:Uncharacterized protein n=1 Tax=Streptomyces acidiscabies TaxID=42234 RepID=A0ABU4MEI6_9ACTN|nr:hypothetical protein [Streptomyces acidiscabies]MDX3025944.1 hypothetical protein [Streptomyces acidiscabies]
MLALQHARAHRPDPALLHGVTYNPVTQMSELDGVPFLDTHGEALASTSHTTTVINSEDTD